MGTKHMVPSGMGFMDSSIPLANITVVPGGPIRDAGCEVALPLTSDEVESLLLT